MTDVLLCIDFIEEIIGPSGRLAQKGYRDFAERCGTLVKLAARQAEIRAAGGRVVHVGLCFAPDYSDHPGSSPLLGGARSAGILRQGSPSTDFVAPTNPKQDDLIFHKNRISPFHGTELEAALRGMGAQTLMIAGVATDLAVQSAARDAHDRDFIVCVAADCCAAASDKDHAQALSNLEKFAAIV